MVNQGSPSRASLSNKTRAGPAQYDKAEPLLLTGYAGLKAAAGDPPVSDSWPIRCTLPCSGLHAAPGAPPLKVQHALDRIVQLYEAWDKPDKAAKGPESQTGSGAKGTLATGFCGCGCF